MVSKLIRVNFKKEHAEHLASHLSKADMNELMVTSGLSEAPTYDEMVVTLTVCDQYSDFTYAVVDSANGFVYAIGGYTEKGVVWFLSSKHLSELDKESRKAFRQILIDNLYVVLSELKIDLWNYVWMGNPKHIKLISSLGARMSGPVTGKGGEQFLKFQFLQRDFIKEV